MSDSEIERQIENQEQKGQLPTNPADNLSQLKPEDLPDKSNLTTDNENVEFNELSLFDEFEKTDEIKVSIEDRVPGAEAELRPFGYEIFNLAPRSF